MKKPKFMIDESPRIDYGRHGEWSPESFRVEPAGDWTLTALPPEGFVVAAVRRVRKGDKWVTLYLHHASQRTVKAMRRRLNALKKQSHEQDLRLIRLAMRGV